MITITFVIPAYKEEKRIQKTLAALSQGFSHPYLILEKVIFVNDGSLDNTVSYIRKQKKKLETILHAEIVILSHYPNQGKGYAIKKGMLASASDYTLFFDVDMSTPLSQISKFISHMKKGTHVIIGTRKNGKATVIEYQPTYRQLLGKAYTTLSNAMLSLSVTDHTCGFKAFSKESKEDLFSITRIKGWAYDSELLFLAQKYKYKVQEVPVLWANDGHSRVRLLRDVLSSLKELCAIRLNDVLGRYQKQSMRLFSPTISADIKS